ncbi:MAG TPA: hypothetical protein DC053_00910 [Lachnoclostridium sp.]|nr:hypothetical protein [Lachnoclostridium sp.]
MVFQNVYLFHDTIRNNICFGNPKETEEVMMRAAIKHLLREIEKSYADRNGGIYFSRYVWTTVYWISLCNKVI